MTRILGQADRTESLRTIADALRVADTADRPRIAALALDARVLDEIRGGKSLESDTLSTILRIAADPEVALRALRIASGAADSARFVTDLEHTLASLPATHRSKALDGLLRATSDVQAIAAAFRTLANLGDSPERRGELFDSVMETLNRTASPADRAKILRLIDELPDLTRRVGIDASESADLLTGLLDTASENQRFVFVESALTLMKTVADRLESAAAGSDEHKDAQRVLDFLRAKLTGKPLVQFGIKPENPVVITDPTAELRHLGSDIRAAARALGDPADPSMIKSLAAGILKDGRMAGSGGWEIDLQKAFQAWSSFVNGTKAQQEFAALLLSARPNMDQRQRAMLAEMQPWFDHFMSKMHPGADDALRLKELERLIGYGQQQGSDLTSQGFDTIMKEIRRDAAGSEGDFDDTTELRREMEGLGISKKEIDERLGDASFDRRMEDLKAGRISVEDHLLGLVQQREEYGQIIKIAKSLGLPTRGFDQKLTEVKGELAATLAMVKMKDPKHGSYELIRGFEAGIGFDQVWVLRDGDRIVEMVFVEAKGPRATTQPTKTKGQQMSPEWIAKTIIRDFARDPVEAIRLIEAIEDETVKIRGLVVQANEDGSPAKPVSAEGADATDGPNLGVYPREGEDSLPAALKEAAKALE